MNKDQTEADKEHEEFKKLASELSSEYGALFMDAKTGNFNSPEYKAQKKALRLKEKELKRRFEALRTKKR